MPSVAVEGRRVLSPRTNKKLSGEYNYKSLDELYTAAQVDDIILKRDWDWLYAPDDYQSKWGMGQTSRYSGRYKSGSHT